jgi:DTW domain-containing protein YfiP
MIGAAPPSDSARCPRCFLPRARCLCAEMPAVRARTRVTIIRHAVERFKNSNTGRLAAMALGAPIIDWGLRDAPWPSLDLGPDAWVLFPDDVDDSHAAKAAAAHAVDATTDADDPNADAKRASPASPPSSPAAIAGPIHLIVLDGSWPQARRMILRVPGLRALPRLALPPPASPDRQRLRRPRRTMEMSTLEAVAAAIALLEGADIARPLELLLERFVARCVPANPRRPPPQM